LAAAMPAAPTAIAFSRRRTLTALARGAAFLLIAYGAWYFYAPRNSLPRLVVLYFLWEATLLTLIWRLIFVIVFSQQRFRQRAIIVGSGAAASLALSTIRRYRARQLDVVGFVPDAGQLSASNVALDLPRIDGARLLEAAADLGASEVVLALREPPSEALLKT